MRRRFAQVDVFSDVPHLGNPLAVVLDADDLTTEAMQRYARWTNLSETTFIVPPTNARADYRVRIFTTATELPFAGHPTLGTCQAWLAAGGAPRGKEIIQECGIGNVRIRRMGPNQFAFAAPPLQRSGPLTETELARVAAGLGLDRKAIIDHAWCDNGAGWCAVMVADSSTVLSLQPNWERLHGLDVGVVGAIKKIGAVAPSSHDDVAFEVRAFFPTAQGMAEDPVTGSLHAGLAHWLIEAGHAPENYVAAQGTAMGRRGRVMVSTRDGQRWIGGAVTTCIEGWTTI